MSLSAKERFIHRELSKTLTPSSKSYFEPFGHTYSYKDKDKTYTQDITLTVLGKSFKTDLTENGGEQYVCCDENGNIYECCIKQNESFSVLTAIRSDRVPKEPKKGKEQEPDDDEEGDDES